MVLNLNLSSKNTIFVSYLHEKWMASVSYVLMISQWAFHYGFGSWFFYTIFYFVLRISLVWDLPRSTRKRPQKREQNSQGLSRKLPAYCSAVMRRYWGVGFGWKYLLGFMLYKTLEKGTTDQLCCVHMPCLPQSLDLFAAEEADPWSKFSQDLGNGSHVEEKIRIFNVIYRSFYSKWKLLQTNLT